MIPERSPRIDASTRLCAVFGHPVRHSGSPAMHNAALESLGLNWRYLAFEVAPASLAEAVAGARDMGFVGINVTVPHKEAALGLVDIQDESARRWGAVNTIRFEGRAPGGSWEPMSAEETARLEERRMVGYNTDADAIVGALEDDLGLDVRGSEVLVVGTGGAGRVAALRLASGGARRLHLVNRTLERARSLAEEIRSRSPGCQASLGYPSGGADLLVNGTSLGLSPSDPLPVDQERFPLSRAARGLRHDLPAAPHPSAREGPAGRVPHRQRPGDAGRPGSPGPGDLDRQGGSQEGHAPGARGPPRRRMSGLLEGWAREGLPSISGPSWPWSWGP